MTHDPGKLLERWWTGVHLAMLAHYEAASWTARWHFRFGVPSIILSSLVGSVVFADSLASSQPFAKYVAGSLSLVVAFLAAVQTFLRLSERSEAHRQAAGKYASLQRELAQLRAFLPEDREELLRQTNALRERWAALTSESPTVPHRVWRRVRREVHRATDTSNVGSLARIWNYLRGAKSAVSDSQQQEA